MEETPKKDTTSAYLPRLLSALGQARASGKNASKWAADALSLLGALQALGRSIARLASHARRASKQRDAPNAELIDAEILEDIREKFQSLIEKFPDAGEVFFGVDTLDDFTRQFFAGSATPSLLGAFEALGEYLDVKLSGFIERLIDWAFEGGLAGAHSEGLKFEQFEEFIRGLENLMQEVLDRWVLPGIYTFDGEDDDS